MKSNPSLIHCTPETNGDPRNLRKRATGIVFRWRKFSSANLNEMAEEEDESKDNNTYTPQFDLSGGNPYKKKET